ncbi:MAG: hypothetical protein R3C11_04750 [Planctomycetaceae bacterium]
MSDTAFAENYLTKLTELLPKLDREKLGLTIAKMREVRDNDKTVYICGNGGSASIASDGCRLSKGLLIRRKNDSK